MTKDFLLVSFCTKNSGEKINKKKINKTKEKGEEHKRRNLKEKFSFPIIRPAKKKYMQSILISLTKYVVHAP